MNNVKNISPTQFFRQEEAQKLDAGAKVFRKFFLKTFGCQMNIADSDIIARIMCGYGYTLVLSAEEADIVFINTCTVRQHAEDRALSYIGRMRQWKKLKPKRLLVVAGCMVERLGRKLKSQFPFIDMLISSKEITHVPQTLKAFENTHPGASVPYPPSSFITIMRGCDNNCSYCIVPAVRGKEICIPAEAIVADVKTRVSCGINDVVLLGQNVNAYKNGISFAQLLNTVACLPGVNNLSFLTSHPKDLGSDTIEVIKNNTNISRTLHLPVQSGSDRILQAMNRGYTREDYLKLIASIRSHISDARITTDIIVGFPGEETSDFENTLSLIDTVRFAKAFVFKYSPREGTAASLILDSVPRETKEKRLEIVLNTLKEKSHACAA